MVKCWMTSHRPPNVKIAIISSKLWSEAEVSTSTNQSINQLTLIRLPSVLTTISRVCGPFLFLNHSIIYAIVYYRYDLPSTIWSMKCCISLNMALLILVETSINRTVYKPVGNWGWVGVSGKRQTTSSSTCVHVL